MLKFQLRRLGSMSVTLFLVAVITFSLIHLTPGDPASVAAGPEASAEIIAEAREQLGLNDPIPVQFWDWFSGLLRGDFGTSFVQNRSVLDMILERIPVSASLVLLSLAMSLMISLPLGILAAVRRDTLVDRVAVLWASAGVALPDFFVGLLLIFFFALNLGFFPATGYVALAEDPVGWARALVLPAFTLGIAVAAELTRHIRASLSDVLELEYVRTARAKGLGSALVVVKHSLRNAALPVTTVLGNQVARLIGGTVIVEQVFNLPGIGQLIVQAIFNRDVTLVLGVGIFAAIVVLVVNALVDASYGWLNPKVRA